MKAIAKQWADASIRWMGGLTTQLQQVQERELAPAQPPAPQPPPANMADLPPLLQQQFAEPVAHPRKVVYYCAGVSVSWHGLVMKGLELFRPSLPYPAAWQEFSGTYLLRQWIGAAPGPVEAGSQPLALVHDFWSVNNYYHWFADVLPRLLVLRELHPASILLLPEGASSYMTLSAQAVGFTNFLFIPRGRIMRGLPVVMPGHMAAIGRQDAPLLRQTRQLLLKQLAPAGAGSSPRRRIFASRRNQRVRRLLNEDSLLPLLARYGIECVLFDAMELPEQVALLQTTELFIGVHGAGLTNMLFLPPGAAVIELLDGQRPNLCYFNLATNLALPYRVVVCEAIATANTHENNYDLHAEANDLERAIEQALA